MNSRARSPRRLLVAALLLVILGVAVYLGRQAWFASRFRAAEATLAKRDFLKARRLLDECLRFSPDDGETLLLAAQAARRDGETSEAARLLEHAERAGAVTEAVDFEQSLTRLQSGDAREVDRFLQVCEEHPEEPESRLILEAVIVGGLQRVDLARTRRSLDLWEKHSQREAERIQGWMWRGELAIRVGDVDSAADFYRRAVEAAPANGQARLRLAELLARTAPREALKQLDQLPIAMAGSKDELFQRARCFRSLGEHERAKELLARILEQSPGNYDAALELGQIELELRQFEAAERWLRAARKIHPDRRDPNLALARCLQLAGKADEARQFREKVAEIDRLLDERLRQLREKGSVEK